jgi:hypothetical protein
MHTNFSKSEGLRSDMPGLGGLQWRVFLAGICGGSARSIIECPFEYAKVKRQTGQTWVYGEIYRGMFPQFFRSTGMMTWYFCMVDTLRRKTNLWNSKLGQFLVSGGSAMTGFWIIWPFEILKNQI